MEAAEFTITSPPIDVEIKPPSETLPYSRLQIKSNSCFPGLYCTKHPTHIISFSSYTSLMR